MMTTKHSPWRITVINRLGTKRLQTTLTISQKNKTWGMMTLGISMMDFRNLVQKSLKMNSLSKQK